MVKNENYVVVQGFMINDLKLKGNELMIYAIIYGFTQEQNQVFSGSNDYLMAWTNSTKQGVIKARNNLVGKGLIVKTAQGYLTTGVNKVYPVSKQSLPERSTKFTKKVNKVDFGGKQSLPNNIGDNLVDNLADNLAGGARAKGTGFTKPTLQEVEEYCLERNRGVDPQKWYDHYTANGWRVGRNPMRDWRAAVRTWERNGVGRPEQSLKSNENPYEQMARVFGEAE